MSIMNIWDDWGPRSNHPPPRKGQNRQTYRSPKSNTNMKGKSGGGGKPPKKSSCPLFLLALLLSVTVIVNAVAQSLLG